MRVGENNRKDGQSTTVFSITERKTSIQIHTDILYCIALHCIALHCIVLYCTVFCYIAGAFPATACPFIG